MLPSTPQLLLRPTNIVAAAAAFSLAWQSAATSTANTATINYGTMTWTSGQYVVLGLIFISNNPASTVSSVTVGGVSLNQVSGAQQTRGASGAIADVWISPSPMGSSSGTVSVTYTASPNSFGLASSVAIYSLSTTTPTAASTSGNVYSVNTNPFVTTPAVPSGGGALVLAWNDAQAALSSWTGATTDAAPTLNQTYAHTNATGTNAINANWVGGETGIITGVAWGP